MTVLAPIAVAAVGIALLLSRARSTRNTPVEAIRAKADEIRTGGAARVLWVGTAMVAIAAAFGGFPPAGLFATALVGAVAAIVTWVQRRAD